MALLRLTDTAHHGPVPRARLTEVAIISGVCLPADVHGRLSDRRP